ncbi:unnamed protein product [Albugo candida]|uniref:Uncharacterized protein n=1 Tax=Albugo candida TaxID=65357 RepID=A0A024G765_9STRA|nr:unnamed protein product [Albugo candida]|eukprot:CCI42166.1 unnamed protein product [Albugo candida]
MQPNFDLNRSRIVLIIKLQMGQNVPSPTSARKASFRIEYINSICNVCLRSSSDDMPRRQEAKLPSGFIANEFSLSVDQRPNQDHERWKMLQVKIRYSSSKVFCAKMM